MKSSPCMRRQGFGPGYMGFGTVSGWLLPFIRMNSREEKHIEGSSCLSLSWSCPSFTPSSAQTLTSIHCNGRHGQKCWGWKEEALRRQAPLGSAPGGAGGQWRTEPFPLLLPDSPGACEVGVSLGGGEGGPAGTQELSYFWNTEHICSSRREGQTLGAGLECRGQAAGGAAVLPLLAAWRAPALPCGEGGATHSKVCGVGRDVAPVAMVMVQCIGGGLGSGTKSKYPLH